MSQDPRPWLQSGAPSPELKDLLESARLDEPTAAQLAGVGAKVTAAVGGAKAAGSAAAGKTAASAAVKTGTGLKVLLAIGTAAAVGGAFQAGRVYEEKTAPLKIVERVVTVPAAPAPPPPVVPEEPQSEPEPQAVKPAAPKRETETAQLAAAMNALGAGDFAKALAACDRHAREYGPKALLVQEREVIAIEALVRLGRKGEAKARAQEFKQAYPTSTHLLKVQALVAE